MRTINYICVHHTAVDQPDLNKLILAVNSNHKKRGLHKTRDGLGYYIAYHYIMGVDGTLKQTRLENEIGYHASNLVVNKESIGIALSGNLDQHEPTSKQVIALFSFIDNIRAKYGQHVRVVYHNMYTKKTCPGKKFPYSLFDKHIHMASKFKEIYEQEVTDPIFTTHDDNEKATIGDVKYIMEIGIARALKKLYTYVDAENKKDRSFINKILSFLKLK